MPSFRLSKLFSRKDPATEQLARDNAERERKAGDRHKRQSRQYLGEWEHKYGHGSATTSADSSGESSGMEKGRSAGSGSTFLSSKNLTGARSIDFLPRLEVSGISTTELAHTPPTPPLRPGSKRASTFSSRPVLAPLQPAQPTPEWDQYLNSRQLGVSKQEQRASQTLSMYSLASRPGALMPQTGMPLPLPVDADEEEDLPLASVAAQRSLSNPIMTRPSTMYDLASVANGNQTSSSLPRSHSRAASLAMPAILASPTFGTDRAHSSRPVAQPFTGKRGTLIDLSEPSKDPNPARSRSFGPVDDGRVVVGDRKAAGRLDKKPEKRYEGPKILDFSELEERHKKRMSILQSNANDHVATESARKRFEAQQKAEAELQRRKEHRQSVRSNLNHAASTPDLGDFGTRKPPASQHRNRSSASISGLSALLKLGGGADRSSTPDLTNSRSRRQSMQSFAQTSSLPATPSATTTTFATDRPPSTARPHLPTRRHSLGTLLEGSMEHSTRLSLDDDDALLEAPRRPFVPADDQRPYSPYGRGRELVLPSEGERKEKVEEWQRRSSSEESLRTASGRRRGESPGSSSEGWPRGVRGESPVPRPGARRGASASEATTATTATVVGVAEGKKKKRHDWLGY